MNKYSNQYSIEKDLEELYKTHWFYWLGIARRYELDEEDTVQEALFSFWKKRDRFVRKSKEETLSLINIEIYNLSRHRARVSVYYSHSVQLSEIFHLSSPYQTDSSDFFLYGNQLKERLSKVRRGRLAIFFDLLYLQGLTYDEILEETGLKARSNLFNSYSEIRRILRDELTT